MSRFSFSMFWYLFDINVTNLLIHNKGEDYFLCLMKNAFTSNDLSDKLFNIQFSE